MNALRPLRAARCSPSGTRRFFTAPPHPRRPFLAAAAAAATIGAATWTYTRARTPTPALDPHRFRAYELLARTPASPDSFILTLRPRAAASHNTTTETPYLGADGTWRFDTWAVETKQPQIQISREYTPLPPGPDGGPDAGSREADGNDPRALRLLVRRVPGGEMSRYLAAVPVGADVFLRGPHPGFGVCARLGAARRLVVLAGGTGVAPALQAAHAVLRGTPSNPDPKPAEPKLAQEAARSAAALPQVTLVWAVRSAADVLAAPAGGLPRAVWTADSLAAGAGAAYTPVAAQLRALVAQSRGRLAVHVVPDADGRCAVDDALVGRVLGVPVGGGEWFSFLRRGAAAPALHAQAQMQAQTPPPPQECALHDPSAVMRLGDRDGSADVSCVCNNSKNVLLVAGPEGFVGFLAGPRAYMVDGPGGALPTPRQGPVAGVVGRVLAEEMQRAEWVVLKMF